jgi:hypothetical protein
MGSCIHHSVSQPVLLQQSNTQNSKLSPAPPHSAAEALEFQQSRGGDTDKDRHRHRHRAAAAHYLDIIGLEIDEDEVPKHETEAKTPTESHHTQHCTHDSHDENDPSSPLLQAAN